MNRWIVRASLIASAVAAIAIGVHAARDDETAVATTADRPVSAAVPRPLETLAVVDFAPRDDPPAARAPARVVQGRSAYLTVVAPPTLAVGDTIDVGIAIDAPREVQDVSFTVKVDPNVAQVRAVREGNWTTDSGLASTFSAEVEAGDGGARVRSRLPRAASADRRADVAIVQLQAVAPGKSAITLSEMQTDDVHGRPTPVAPRPGVDNIVRVESTLPGRS